MTEVAAAVVERDGLFLLCRRPEGKRCAGLWEFPGGKLEPGETAEVALIRECREELDARVRPLRRIARVENDGVGVLFILCALEGDEPKRLEHSALCWARPVEARALALCPADARFLAEAGSALEAAAREAREARKTREGEKNE